jgi:hypothetical protein
MTENKTVEDLRISEEDLNKIKQLQSKAAYIALLAEKAYADAKVAELEANNFTLIIYNKYGLVNGQDSITNDGTIIKLEKQNLKE